ncbi:hypothetical protein [Maribacter cobaltidurans]|uniref:Uncharacterized protein n=1 Tax=Maribacter cobaltidurans TaxID=1178778 RepID=A0A223V3P4_9FLAO|nr:hypothetical protein [Maribacter cobaltidurans]ASV30025.1 hypothetical protein CJ263_07205 [Maribacter cobaltidurans]
MYGFNLKIFRFSLLGILPFLLISNSGKEMNMEVVAINNENLIPSELNFGYSTEESIEGTKFKKLTLVFQDITKKNRIELIMGTTDEEVDFQHGDFTIKEVEGFLHGYEGVFGYFTNSEFGEKPFFAKNGFVRILNLDDDHIEGYMDLTLVNDYGKKIRISDTFRNF